MPSLNPKTFGPSTLAWLATLQPPSHCCNEIEWKAGLFDIANLSGAYGMGGNAAAAAPAPASNGKFSDRVLSLIQRSSGNMLTLAQLETETEKAPNIIGRALATLKGQKLITESPEGVYHGAGNVSGIGAGKTARTPARGRPRAAANQQRTGTTGD